MMDELRPYKKVVLTNSCAVCAIYEPHPFRDRSVREAIERSGYKTSDSTGVANDAWCWVYYDWCGNPIGLSEDEPNGTVVDKFTDDNLGSDDLAEYLNHENQDAIDAWWKHQNVNETPISPTSKWCNNQSVDELGKVICLAHLAEARVPDCPYKSKEERVSAKYPCSDYEEVRT